MISFYRTIHHLAPARPKVGALLCVMALGILLILWQNSPVYAQESGITSPGPGSNVTDPAVPVLGSAVSNQFQKYELHFKPTNSGDDAYSYFDGGTDQIQNGQLGVWNVGGLAPGAYTIRLRVVFPDGNYSEFRSENINVGQTAPEPTETPTETSEDDEDEDDNEIDSDPLGPQTSNGPTETPIPTLAPTSGPPATAAVGQVAQPASAENNSPNTPTPETIALADTSLSTDGATDGVPLTQENAAANNAVVFDPAAAAAESGESASRQVGEALSLNRLRTYFFNGMRYSAAFFIAVLALFGGKRLFDWAWTNYT